MLGNKGALHVVILDCSNSKIIKMGSTNSSVEKMKKLKNTNNC
jgi:hypothetical protein